MLRFRENELQTEINANAPIEKRWLDMQTFIQSDKNSLNNGQNNFNTVILF